MHAHPAPLPAAYPPPPGDNRLAAAFAELASRGWTRIDGWLPADLAAALAAEMIEAEAAPAGVGREEDYTLDRGVRRAAIAWLDGRTDAQRRLLAQAEELRAHLNRALFLGLFEFEACCARYPAGGFYARHRDSLRGARNRVVSLVAYLNPEWRAEWGGALRVWPPDGGPAQDTPPAPGTVVLMLSEETEHEVLPTLRPRLALAAWWRVNASTPDRIDPAH